MHRDWHIQIDTIKYSVPHTFAGTNVDVRIIGDQLDVLAGGAVVATHTRGVQRGVYVTDPGHGPTYFEESQGLWTRAYFLRQAAKAGPATVAALERLLDSRKIEAQGFRPCMNILDLGKRGGREVLEAACVRLIADEHRQISYTGVKHAIAAIRAERDARPTTVGAPPGAPPSGRVQVRDTRAPGRSRRLQPRDTPGRHQRPRWLKRPEFGSGFLMRVRGPGLWQRGIRRSIGIGL